MDCCGSYGGLSHRWANASIAREHERAAKGNLVRVQKGEAESTMRIISERKGLTSGLGKPLVLAWLVASAFGFAWCGGAAQGATPEPTVTWGYFQGMVSSPGALIGTQDSLAKMVPAHFKFIPINSGVAALAAMRAGSFDVVEGVGNPPVVGALAARTPLVVVFAESYDGAGLYVNTNVIHNTSDLAGQNIGDLVGSSEDYELKGYLRANGLLDKVHVVPFASDAAAASAFLAGKLNAAYLDYGSGVPVAARPGTQVWTTAAKIAELGYPSLNVLVVSRKLATEDKALTQRIVCAVAAASDAMVGPDRAKYFAASAPLLGEPPAAAVKGSEMWPELTLQQQSEWFGAPGKNVIDSKMVQEAYLKSADFLLKSGAVTKVPSAQEIAAAVDRSFVDAGLQGACK
jgi:taurine transport system substrate-binding protein